MFYQLEDYRGVDTDASTTSIMVPQGGYNLIVHDGGRSPQSQWNTNGVTFSDLTDSLKKNAGVATQLLTKIVGSPLEIWRAARLLDAASRMDLGERKRLVAITSRTPGFRNVTLAGKSLDIDVRKRRTVLLYFVYYFYVGVERQRDWQALGGSVGGYSGGYPLGDINKHSQYAIDGLNQYFIPQANIEFVRKDLRRWESDTWNDSTLKTRSAHTPSAQPEFDLADGDKYEDTSAVSGAITVFVVPHIYGSGEGAFGTRESDPLRQVWVPWIFFASTARHNPNGDLFIPLLGHEIVHQLGRLDGSHSSRAEVMCNDHTNSHLDEEVLIDRETADLMERRWPFAA